MARFLKSHSDLVCRSVVKPQENLRVQISREYLDADIDLIREWVLVVPTELVFTINESGFSDWEEREPTCLVIPTEARAGTLY
jgi:hypothetical protein